MNLYNELNQVRYIDNLRFKTTNAEVGNAATLLELALLRVMVKAMEKEANPDKTELNLTEAEIATLDKNRDKIKCIKMVRERTGMGLIEAKNIVENYMMKKWGYMHFPTSSTQW